MDLSRFGAAPAWSLGVEEELMLVNAETLEPARVGFSRVFGEATERIKPELFESFVEITTGVVETAEEAEAELRALRHEVSDRAAQHGLALLATGSHPTARGIVPIVPVERYRKLKAQLGPRLYRQRGFFAYMVLCTIIFTALMFTSIPPLYSLFNVDAVEMAPLWTLGQ